MLKKLPLIGTIISFGYAFTRFKSGDVFGGMLDIASGLASLVPGIGTVLSIGIDVFSAMRDIKTPQEERVKQDSSAGTALLKIMGSMVMNAAKRLIKTVKWIPFLGSALSLFEAYKNFKGRNWLKGSLSLLSALAPLLNLVFPGLGTGIGIGLDILNAFIKPKGEKGEESAKESKSEGPGIFASAKQWIAEKLKKYARYIPIIGTFIRLKETWQDFKSGQIMKGLISLVGAITSIVPVLGGTIGVGVDALNSFLFGKKEEVQKDGSKKESKSVWETIKDYLKDKIQKVFKRLVLFGSGMKSIFAGDYVPGFTDLASAFSGVPVIGGVFGTIRDWLTQPEENVAGGEQQAKPKKSLMEMLKERSVKKFIDIYKKMPGWLQWITKKAMPAEVEKLLSQYDKPEDTSNIGTLPEGGAKKKGSKLNPMNWFGGEEEAMANDFIWRKGQKVQKINSKDNIIGVKNDGVFDRLLAALENKKKDSNDESLIKIVESLEKDIQKMIMQLNNNITSMSGWIKESSKPTMSGSGVPPPPAQDLAGVNDRSFDARDPAWTLRSRAWDRIRKGYVVI